MGQTLSQELLFSDNLLQNTESLDDCNIRHESKMYSPGKDTTKWFTVLYQYVSIILASGWIRKPNIPIASSCSYGSSRRMAAFSIPLLLNNARAVSPWLFLQKNKNDKRSSHYDAWFQGWHLLFKEAESELSLAKSRYDNTFRWLVRPYLAGT